MNSFSLVGPFDLPEPHVIILYVIIYFFNAAHLIISLIFLGNLMLFGSIFVHLLYDINWSLVIVLY